MTRDLPDMSHDIHEVEEILGTSSGSDYRKETELKRRISSTQSVTSLSEGVP